MKNRPLQNYIQLFEYYKSQADQAISQINDEHLYWSPGEKDNSVAVIMQHIAGNMKSRWTDFLTTDGEKSWRNRDQEFVMHLSNKEELYTFWEQCWAILFSSLMSVDDDNINTVVYIRNQSHTVEEAVQRQLAHYASHIGQIVYLCKMIKGNEFVSLSIPNGQSQSYNTAKFELDKNDDHFTTQYIT